MNKHSKYRPLMDVIQTKIMRAEIGVTNLYQIMLETLDDIEKEDKPKWTSIKNPPSKTCYAWVASGNTKELCEFYICPEYGDAFWLDVDGEDLTVHDSFMYSIINEPELPEVEE